MATLREALGDNYKKQQRPWNVQQLIEDSGVARESIAKMIDGDYSHMRMVTVNKVWRPFNVTINVVVEFLNGN